MLLSFLPPIVHLRNESDRAKLRWLLERMMRELREAKPGGSLVAQHLASMMVIQALWLHLAGGGEVVLVVIRPCRQEDEHGDRSDAPRSGVPLDITGTWEMRRHVAVKLRFEIQGHGWDVTHGIADPMADAVGR